MMNTEKAHFQRRLDGLNKRLTRPLGVVLWATFGLHVMPGLAFAEEPTPAPAPTTTTESTPSDPAATPPRPAAPPNVAVPQTTPPASAKELATWDASLNATAKKTDHESIVGSYGLGFMGSNVVSLPIARSVGRAGQSGLFPNDKVDVRSINIPTLGIRRWKNNRYGVDLALGLAFSGGGTTGQWGDVTKSVDKESTYAFAANVGIPVMVRDTQHMTFLIVPEAKFGFAFQNASSQIEQFAPPDAELRGLQFDLGARAGAELHFGFIGLPRLALQVGVGAYFTAKWVSATAGDQSISDSTVGVGFISTAEPWSILSGFGTLGARYYF